MCTIWGMTNYCIGRIDPHRPRFWPHRPAKEGQGYKTNFTVWIGLLGRRFWQCLIWSQTNKPSQWTRTSVEAIRTNAVTSAYSSSRTCRETARPRKGADERGGLGADRGRRRAFASRVRRHVESQVRVALHVRVPKTTRTGRLLPSSVSSSRRRETVT